MNHEICRWMAGLLFVLALCVPQKTVALGRVQFDSQSFLKSSRDRASLAGNLSLAAEYEKKGRWVSGKMDLRTYTFIDHPASFDAESKNAYLSTTDTVFLHHELSLGRRHYSWSVADDYWRLGTWSPRYQWDPLQPEQIGLTGVFYEYRSKDWNVRVYGSPVAIPERGFFANSKNENGKVTSPNPLWVRLPETVVLSNGERVPIQYETEYPSIGEILLRPSAAMRVSYGDRQGPWTSLAYGILPIHQIESMSDTTLVSDAGATVVKSTIQPKFLYHHQMTSEFGYRGSYWGLWGSLTGEIPIQQNVPANWIRNTIGPSLTAAWGGTLFWNEGLSFDASFISVAENPENVGPLGQNQSIQVPLPSRFPYRRAVSARAHWQALSPVVYDFGWTFDTENLTNLVSVDLTFTPGKRNRLMRETQGVGWQLGLGADLIASATGQGWMGQFVGNDRIRGSVHYAF